MLKALSGKLTVDNRQKGRAGLAGFFSFMIFSAHVRVFRKLAMIVGLSQAEYYFIIIKLNTFLLFKRPVNSFLRKYADKEKGYYSRYFINPESLKALPKH